MEENFRKRIKSKKGCAVIMAGSESDREHIKKVAASLEKYDIPFQVRICSAHKQPEHLMEIIKEYNEEEGLIAFVAIAGGTDALSGTLSFHTMAPVISCPPDNLSDSVLHNPSGSSNAYIPKTENVGRFIAQLFAGVNPRYRKILIKEINNKIKSLEEADKKMNFELSGV
jgi:5-(carboxyamino)imidazole ribonucleotide mutase